MPALRHDDVRDELFAGLSGPGRVQFEAFASVYEARQVAAQLAELRTQAQLSQRETARRAGIDQADLSRIESAQITPSLPTLLRLLDAVGGSLLLARNATPVSRASKAAGAPAGTVTKKALSPQKSVAKMPPTRKGPAQGLSARPTKMVASRTPTRTPLKGVAASASTTSSAPAAKKPAKRLARV